MSKTNPLASLIGNYGDSDDESDNESRAHDVIIGQNNTAMARGLTAEAVGHSASIHPAPIAHCPWSACYDETSGFTYYWNQQTNAVTWEAPPEYLLALKLAQQQLHTQGSAEVSAEEWQLYQQALAEKQHSKVLSKGALIKPVKAVEKTLVNNNKNFKKRKVSVVEDEKIELITSYHNSDSESNEEPESPVKNVKAPIQPPLPKVPIIVNKKSKIKSTAVAYGPTLPQNQNYSMPIGPELPIEKVREKSKSPEINIDDARTKNEVKTKKASDNEDSNDESLLLMKLKNKAKLLEKLGGELPSGLQKIIEEETKALSNSPISKGSNSIDNNIDELLNEIETKELPKVIIKKIDMFNEQDAKSNDSIKRSPKSRDMTPPFESKPLFPSVKNITADSAGCVISSVHNEVNVIENHEKHKIPSIGEKKGSNLYLIDREITENVSRKRLRISNSVLPERKRNETPSYTTKYSQHIDGFSNERTGLGFTKDEETEGPVKNTFSYGNGLTFTKGETLNEEKKDEDLDDLTDLVEAKLKYLNQLQPCTVTAVQEMLIQMQTLVSAFRAGSLSPVYWRRWAEASAQALQQHEASAAPPGWTCAFQRSEGRYRYRRESDGLVQWEYPAVASTDMDISMTPPHPGIEARDEVPPLPSSPPRPPPPPPHPARCSPPQQPAAPPAPAPRVHTPPPPAWTDPPPPGCDDLTPLPAEQHRQIGDELMSFYNDIAELEKHSSEPNTARNTPSPPRPSSIERETEKEKTRDRDKDIKTGKKKSKVKISSSVGLKHRSVSSLVAKWQQVADEISSD